MSLPNQRVQVLTNPPNRPSTYGQSIGEAVQSTAAIHIHRELESLNYQHKQFPTVKFDTNRLKFRISFEKFRGSLN